mmetsp:Transcript_11398/g.20822  ORF Transcript_11398/g.20822 Transcript_11398/m.20822 type:complete len:126 (+) Transcript_11398:60-437(+)
MYVLRVSLSLSRTQYYMPLIDGEKKPRVQNEKKCTTPTYSIFFILRDSDDDSIIIFFLTNQMFRERVRHHQSHPDLHHSHPHRLLRYYYPVLSIHSKHPVLPYSSHHADVVVDVAVGPLKNCWVA